MVKAYSTPWPEGRPPHMILTNRSLPAQPQLEKMIRHHQKGCEECRTWANEHDDDIEHWIYPRAP